MIKGFQIPYKIFCEIILDGVLSENYLEGVCWDYNPCRLPGSQWHLNDYSFSANFRFGLRLCLNIRRQIHVSDSDMFLSLYLNMLHLVQSAVDEGFMVGRGSVLGRHPRCETACWSAQPMLGPRWRDQIVSLRKFLSELVRHQSSSGSDLFKLHLYI